MVFERFSKVWVFVWRRKDGLSLEDMSPLLNVYII